MVNGLKQDYKRTTNYHQMWRARDRVHDWYLGGQRESFHMIPSLLEKLKEVDLGCVVHWNMMEDSQTFERAFICPSMTRDALKYC